MELYKIDTKDVFKILLTEITNQVPNFNKYSKNDQKLILLNILAKNTVIEEIINQANYLLNQ